MEKTAGDMILHEEITRAIECTESQLLETIRVLSLESDRLIKFKKALTCEHLFVTLNESQTRCTICGWIHTI